MLTRGIFLILTSIFLLFETGKAGQDDITVTASVNNNSLFSGERFVYTIEISGANLQDISRPRLPEIHNARNFSQIPSTSSSISIINGVYSARYSYSFTLEALNEGAIEIPAIEIEVAGNMYRTNPISLMVYDRAQSRQRVDDQPEIFLRLELSERRPYRGQQISADLVIYFKPEIDILSYQPAGSWRTEGFWSENLADGTSPRAETVITGGVRYRRAKLLSYALFPTRSGSVEIGEYRINASVRRSARFGDSGSRFFGGMGRSQETIEVRSEPVTLNVRPLPQPVPSHFSGAVGEFTFERTAPVREVMLGEPIEIITSVRGTGNVALVNKPVYEAPDSFESYRPQENINTAVSGGRIRGSKTFTEIFIPRRTGAHTLEATTVSHFDPARNRYVSHTLPAIEFSIVRDPDAVPNVITDTRLRLNTLTGIVAWSQVQPQTPVPQRWWFWLFLIFPVLVIGSSYYGYIYLDKYQNDKGFSRAVTARKKAMKDLQEARSALPDKDSKKIFRLITNAITGYISDRLNLHEAGWAPADVEAILMEKNVDEKVISEAVHLLKLGITIQYAPNMTETDLEKHISAAEQVIVKLGENL